MNEIEGETVTVADWPDGSRVTVDRYRSDVIAPWAYGQYEGYCGTCKDEVHAADEQDARIRLLEHLLFHAFEEIQEIHRKLARKSTVSFRNG